MHFKEIGTVHGLACNCSWSGAFLVGGLVLLLLLLRYRHAVSRLQWTAVFGVIFLLCFALIRAVSLHAIDAFLYASSRRNTTKLACGMGWYCVGSCATQWWLWLGIKN